MQPHALRAAAGATVLALALAPAGFAQGDEELKREIEALKKGQQEIRGELQEIKKLLQQRPAPAANRPVGPDVAGKVIDLGANPVKGQDTAKLTLVEFLDYQ